MHYGKVLGAYRTFPYCQPLAYSKFGFGIILLNYHCFSTYQAQSPLSHPVSNLRLRDEPEIGFVIDLDLFKLLLSAERSNPHPRITADYQN